MTDHDMAAEVAEKEVDMAYSPQEEKKLVRKLDWNILPLLIITNALDFLDKSTFSIAVLYGMGEDLGLVKVIGQDPITGNPITDSSNFSFATMIFYIGYIIGAYPWSIAAQKLPAAKVVSVACFLWSLIGILTPVCTNFSGVLANRFFLGMAESAVSPIFSVYICYFWSRDEQVTRSSAWYAAGGISSVIGPAIGGAIGLINHGVGAWKYMYYIICGVGIGFSVVLFFFLPDNPMQARFLTDREKQIAMDRLRTSQTGAMETKLNWNQIRECLTDHNIYFLLLFVFASSVPGSALTSFSSLVVAGFGYDNLYTLLLLMPMGAVTVLGLVVSSTISIKFKGMRYWCILVLLVLELVGALLCWQVPDSMAARYAGLCLFPFVVSSTGICVSLASSNVAGHTKKYLLGAAVFIANSVGSIVGSILFGASPGPLYNTGFISNVAFTVFCIVLACASRWRLGSINKSRDERYGPHSTAQDDDDVVADDLTDKENKSFRYLL